MKGKKAPKPAPKAPKAPKSSAKYPPGPGETVTYPATRPAIRQEARQEGRAARLEVQLTPDDEALLKELEKVYCGLGMGGGPPPTRAWLVRRGLERLAREVGALPMGTQLPFLKG